MIADLFVREDLSKLENRINVALFGLLAVAWFHDWLVAPLGFFAAVVIYPTTNVVGDQGSIRPDFVVKHAETEEILAWIEVECWRDDAQLARFRSLLRERVIAIWGRTGTPADLGLDEIAAFLDAFDVGGEHPQVRHNLAHLRKLIGEVLDGAAARTYKPMPVADAVLQTPFVRALRDALGVLLSLDVGGPMRPGEIRANTRGERGFSLRVHSEAAGEHSLSILHQYDGQPKIKFLEGLVEPLSATEKERPSIDWWHWSRRWEGTWFASTTKPTR
nr:hypothetical protein [Deltaproteobacteria bacterium]